MRNLGWLLGGLLLASCSVNPVDTTDGGSGNTGGSGGHATGAGGTGQTGAGGATTGTGGHATGAGGAVTGAGGATTGAGGATTGAGGATTGAGGSGTGAGGATGQGGSNGQAGHGGGTDGGASCSDLVNEYAQAYTEALACTPGAPNQCQHLVQRTLATCPGCEGYVNDTTMLDAIRKQWTDDNCGSTPIVCPLAVCATPGAASCVASSSGSGNDQGTCTSEAAMPLAR